VGRESLGRNFGGTDDLRELNRREEERSLRTQERGREKNCPEEEWAAITMAVLM
jgi:hypothetical protein